MVESHYTFLAKSDTQTCSMMAPFVSNSHLTALARRQSRHPVSQQGVNNAGCSDLSIVNCVFPPK